MNYRKFYITGVSFFIGFLFLYAGFSKLIELDVFFKQLGKSPLIPSGLKENVGIGVLAVEFLVVYFVYKNRFKIALLISFFLMVFFSFYIAYLMYFSYFIPCSCGGILGTMSWGVHLIFNIVLTVIIAIAFLLSE
jgi:hypothetical protein